MRESDRGAVRVGEPSRGAVRVEHHGAVAVLLLDNPARRNAITLPMWRQLLTVLAELAVDDGVRVLLVRGVGGTFSAGADISELAQILHDPATGHHGGPDITAAEEALAAFPKPTVAALEGHCVGGGWQLAGACDVRLASTETLLGVTPANIGILYPLSGVRRLVALAGPATAKYLLLSGELIGAVEALSLGLVTRVLPAEGFWPAVLASAGAMADRSAFSQYAHKELVNALSDGAPAGEVAALYTTWQERMLDSPDAALGVAAFLAKEPPRFRWGRPEA